MEQRNSKESKNPEKETKKECSGNQCYHGVKAGESYYVTYKRDVRENEECVRPSPEEKFGVQSKVFGSLERYALAHCRANGDGDELCNHPCKCKPVISDQEINFGKIRKFEDKCQIFVKASVIIKCRCSDSF